MGISFGGDPTSFMEAPRMENKDLGQTLGAMGGSPIGVLLDLVGIHKQVAREPKTPEGQATPPERVGSATSPAVLSEVESALSMNTPTRVADIPITPTEQNAPVTPWGQRWLESLRPLQSIDPNTAR